MSANSARWCRCSGWSPSLVHNSSSQTRRRVATPPPKQRSQSSDSSTGLSFPPPSRWLRRPEGAVPRWSAAALASHTCRIQTSSLSAKHSWSGILDRSRSDHQCWTKVAGLAMEPQQHRSQLDWRTTQIPPHQAVVLKYKLALDVCGIRDQELLIIR